MTSLHINPLASNVSPISTSLFSQASPASNLFRLNHPYFTEIKKMTNLLRVFFLFFAFSMASCASDKPEDVAYEFLNEYYEVKDIHKVKSYLHPDLRTMIDSGDENIVKMWGIYEEIIMPSSSFDISFINKKEQGKDAMLFFAIKGLKNNEKMEEKIRIKMRRFEDEWKVFSLGL